MADKLDNAKPLPGLPEEECSLNGLPPGVPELTSIARLHLQRLITQSLESENLNLQWLPHIERALVDLSEAGRQGRWTDAVLRARSSTKNASLHFDDALTTEETHHDISTGVKADVSPSEDVSEAADENLRALASLSDRIHTQATTPDKLPGHLILTLSTPETAPRILPDFGLDFDLMPHREACYFTQDQFSLPFFETNPEERRGSGGAILVGFESWKNLHCDSPATEIRIVGGNFTIKGVNAKEDNSSLCRVLRIGIYGLLSLQLELGLHRTFGIPLVYPPPPQTQGSDTRLTSVTESSKPKPRRDKAASGIWSFLTKNVRPLHHLDQHRLIAKNPHPTAGSPRRASFDLTRTFSHNIKLSSADHEVQNSPLTGRRAGRAESFPTIFTDLVRRLEDESVILSSSPDVRIPPPALIVRLAERESVVALHPPSSRPTGYGKIRLTGADKTGLNSILGWSSLLGSDSADDPNLRLTGSRGFVRHQGLTLLYGERVLANNDSAEEGSSLRGTLSAESKSSQSRIESTNSTIANSSTESGSSFVPSRASSPGPTISNSQGQSRLCLKSHWHTYRFYSFSQDEPLGDFVRHACSAAERGDICKRDACGALRRDHSMEWIHAAIKITCYFERSAPSGFSDTNIDGDTPTAWSSCKVCDQRTEPSVLDGVTSLHSFAKFLELLIYSPSFAAISPPLCGHTSPSDLKPETSLPIPRRYPAPNLPPCRFNILRHFRSQGQVLLIGLSSIDNDIFEVKAPRIQITRTAPEIKRLDGGTAGIQDKEPTSVPSSPTLAEDDERDRLRLEITYWFVALKEHVTLLEDYIAGATARLRTKRLPSTPETSDSEPELPPKESSDPDQLGSNPQSASKTIPLTPEELPDLLLMLQKLLQTFQVAENGLYRLLNTTPMTSLNDVRRRFHSEAMRAKKRMTSWEDTNIAKSKRPHGPARFDSTSVDPEWWSAGTHLMPKSKYIIREKDLGSIIACTLRSSEYKKELKYMSTGRMASSSTAPGTPTVERPRPNMSTTPSSTSINSTKPSQTSSLLSQATSSTLTAKPESGNLDDGTGDWDEEEDYSAVITRKEHPRDGAGILGLRDVLRNQRSVESPPSSSASILSGSGSNTGIATAGGVSSHIRSLGNSASKLMRYGLGPGSDGSDYQSAPPSAWAKAELQVSLRPAQGELRAIDAGALSNGVGEEKLVGILTNLDGSSLDVEQSTLEGVPSRSRSSTSTLKSSPSKLVKTPSSVEEADEESTLSESLVILDSTMGSSEDKSASGTSTPTEKARSKIDGHTSLSDNTKEPSTGTIGPPVPPKSTPRKRLPNPPSISSRESRILISGSPQDSTVTSSPTNHASNTGSITSTFASAIRYVLGTPGPSPPPKQHLGLLAIHPSSGTGFLYPPIDDRPHLKYDFTLGQKLKFSCTVYYARQFDFLRKRCGITTGSGEQGYDENLLRSLERCVGWEAEGGKSRSSFLKTEDDKYIIKTLVNAWNVADLQVLLELAPSYFRYMDTTASRASVLAKLMGFYTIEIQNLDPRSSGGKVKADLLVMENLFWNYNIAPGRTFDLKGIAVRKVKHASPNPPKDPPPGEEDGKSETSIQVEKRKVKAPAHPSHPKVGQKPLFDKEWIEGQQRELALVDSHSKTVLHDAIKCDSEWLAKSNIMDYSLLLGIDRDRRQMTCGLVDTIGSYTFAKTLEYKAKQGLIGGSGKEITVVPPTEYKDRFVAAMETYFLACPDKWSKGGNSEVVGPEDLPSVY